MMTLKSEIEVTGSSVTLARSSDGVTVWRRIVDSLQRDISNGVLAPGAKMPSENELASRFEVNRHTVRRALSVLAERGIVRATRGSGTFVEARPLAYPITHRTRFSEILTKQSRQPGGELIDSLIEDADEATAACLKLPVGTRVLRMHSVRRADGVPISLAVSWFIEEIVPDFDLVFAATKSITRSLATFGITDYRRVTTQITASTADAEDAERLDLAPGRPILVLESVNADVHGRPIERTISRFAADRVQVEIR